jgi:hypothetical protein
MGIRLYINAPEATILEILDIPADTPKVLEEIKARFPEADVDDREGYKQYCAIQEHDAASVLSHFQLFGLGRMSFHEDGISWIGSTENHERMVKMLEAQSEYGELIAYRALLMLSKNPDAFYLSWG